MHWLEFLDLMFLGSVNMNMLYKKYKHTRTRSVYTLLMITNENSTREDFVKTAVYMDIEGNVWSRSYLDFIDRFEPIEPFELPIKPKSSDLFF